MRYSFYAQTPPPSLAVLRSWPGGLLCEEVGEDGFAGPMQDGQILHVYQPGVTTRSVELAYERGAFQARVMTLACHADYKIALHLTCAVARAAGTPVESEEGVQFAPEDVDDHYGDAWIDDHVQRLVGSTVAIVRDHGEVVMSGAHCSVHLDGPTLDRVLRGATTPAHQAEALFTLFRDVSHPDEAWFKASVMSVSLKDGAAVTLVVLGPGVQVQLPRAQLLALVTDENLLVPWSLLGELVGDRLSWVDAATARVLPIPDAEWPALLARARAHQTTLEDFAAASAPAAGADDPPSSMSPEAEVASDKRFLIGVGLTVLLALVSAWFVIQGMG